MAARLLQNQKVFLLHAKTQLNKRTYSQVAPFELLLGYLSKQEQDAYLHKTILENIVYYKALVKYRQRRNKYIIYRDGRQYKNLRMFYRLTEKGLCLLKTGYAKKPKNPV